MNVIITFILYFFVFAVIHSLFATNYVKNKAEKLLKDKFRFYRLIYTLISFPIFAPAFLTWLEDTALTPAVYSIPQLLAPFILLIRLLAIGLFMYAAVQTDILEFAGIRQIRGKTSDRLITGGAYGIVRHPLYTAAIVALFTKMDMSLLDLTAILAISIYFIIGAFIEERRLLSTFGEEYRKYQKQVSMFIPVKWIMSLKSHI